MKETLFQKISAVTLEEDAPVLRDAWVLVRDGKIASVGTEEPSHGPDCEIIDGTRKALLPSFVNAHTHLPMTALRGYADGVPLQSWLSDWIFPAEDRLDDRAVKASTDLALAELLASGTTSASDMYMFCDTIARCALDAGLKLNISRGMTCFGAFDPETLQSVKDAEALIRDWHGAGDGRILAELCIHGEYTSPPELWRWVADRAAESGLGVHLHLSETESEQEACLRRWGKTPAAALAEAGVFRNRVTAAHCVWVTDEDIALLRQSGAAAIHCPVSNAKLGSGVAPLEKLTGAGVTVALGTDGASSNDALDLFGELKLTALLQRAVCRDAGLIRPIDVLRMATAGGAAAQGRAGECGKLAVGMDADLMVLDLDRPGLYPEHSLLSNLVYCATGRDVWMTMCRGETLYKAGQWLTVDVERAAYEMEHYAAPLVSGRLR